jgi:tetratricopeptide (TPR) repeat protein
MSEAERLFAEGEAWADEELDAEALACFKAALAALPHPPETHPLAVEILAAIADSHFHLSEWGQCADAVQQAFRWGAALDNTFLRLRLGQALFELGNVSEALNWLVPVYLMDGLRPFEGEDPKYLASFREKLEPPPGGWPEGW